LDVSSLLTFDPSVLGLSSYSEDSPSQPTVSSDVLDCLQQAEVLLALPSAQLVTSTTTVAEVLGSMLHLLPASLRNTLYPAANLNFLLEDVTSVIARIAAR
jgi:hypothetical protein